MNNDQSDAIFQFLIPVRTDIKTKPKIFVNMYKDFTHNN